MNTDTGQVYYGESDIAEARKRGETVVEVSERVAMLMERAQIEMTKEARRAAWRARWFENKTPDSE